MDAGDRDLGLLRLGDESLTEGREGDKAVS